MKIHFGMASKRGRVRRAWFYWRPHMFWERPALFQSWEFSAFWLCFYFVAEGDGRGLL
ncbi:hypothetical protein [Achromobacter ruhlandii]|uniref:hypothetical protein n=1 Tax=Achromobacter ruhlandii TaxID=72557 RepID=UPI000AA1DE78|nr:hypothetical protein [Achromobacter ruhlandii]